MVLPKHIKLHNTQSNPTNKKNIHRTDNANSGIIRHAQTQIKKPKGLINPILLRPYAASFFFSPFPIVGLNPASLSASPVLYLLPHPLIGWVLKNAPTLPK